MRLTAMRFGARKLPFVLSLTIAATFGCLLPIQTSYGQGSVVTTLSDLNGLFIDLDVNPVPTPGDVMVTADADIFRLSTAFGDAVNQYQGAFAEYDISSLDPDGIFSARVVGTIQSKSATPGGTREISTQFYEGNGVIEGGDAFASSVSNPSFPVPDVSYDPATDSSVDVDIDVTRQLRQIVRNGATHFGARFQGANSQGPSTISAVDPIDLEITEYFANPIDAAPQIVGNTGLSFRGQAGEFVSQGATRLLTPADWNFELRDNFDNGISVRIDSRTSLDRWDLDFSAPNDALLQPGDSFDATRWPFQSSTEAGFDISGEFRGHNALTARFTINDVAYDTNGDVIRLDAEFIQRGLDGIQFGAPVMVGRIQVNAVPEPASFAFLAGGCAAVMVYRRRKRLSRDQAQIASAQS
ncbi:MAG: hypothetical protein MI861_24395 [Pirellulales bacterium]|nr:hypothetical protein [Pirellulales bacterium]